MQGHFARTIILALNRSRVAATLVGRGLLISHSAARLSTSNLTSAPCDGPNARKHKRLRSDAGGMRSLALTSRHAVVTKDRVWAEVASTVGAEVRLLVQTLYLRTVVVRNYSGPFVIACLFA